ncbi:hypothetical protein [Maribacter sp. 2-571]|uniref:hypothetical protein n=1 Tax=Maribacter sp. 2-571 TaxID=3417569 RepID=UPI003D354FA2
MKKAINFPKFLRYLGILLLFAFATVSGQEEVVTNDTLLLRNFRNEFILSESDSLPMDVFHKYVNIHKSLKGNPYFENLLLYIKKSTKESIGLDPDKYEINFFISHNDLFALHPELFENEKRLPVSYGHMENVYYGVNNGKNKTNGIFIVEKGKIISFFPHIAINPKEIHPFLLNEPVDMELLETISKYATMD